MKRLLFLVAGCAVGALMMSCSGPPPRVLHASVSGPVTIDYYATDKSLTLTQRPSGDVMRIMGSRPPEGGSQYGVTIILDITSGVQSGPAVYNETQGSATIDINGESWSSDNTGNFACEITQFDLSKSGASGTFRFTAKRNVNDTETVIVSDGSFLLINTRVIQ